MAMKKCVLATLAAWAALLAIGWVSCAYTHKLRMAALLAELSNREEVRETIYSEVIESWQDRTRGLEDALLAAATDLQAIGRAIDEIAVGDTPKVGAHHVSRCKPRDAASQRIHVTSRDELVAAMPTISKAGGDWNDAELAARAFFTDELLPVIFAIEEYFAQRIVAWRETWQPYIDAVERHPDRMLYNYI